MCCGTNEPFLWIVLSYFHSILYVHWKCQAVLALLVGYESVWISAARLMPSWFEWYALEATTLFSHSASKVGIMLNGNDGRRPQQFPIQILISNEGHQLFTITQPLLNRHPPNLIFFHFHACMNHNYFSITTVSPTFTLFHPQLDLGLNVGRPQARNEKKQKKKRIIIINFVYFCSRHTAVVHNEIVVPVGH